jgi:anti-sigma-K factor RskA
MTDDKDIDALAGQYVLGTLDVGERAAVAARRLREPLLNTAITDWERRLAPLGDAVAPVTPPIDLFAKIEARIKGEDVAPAGSATIIDLRRRLKVWRAMALASSALAACLVVAFGVREFQPKPKQQNLVAVLQEEAASPAFLVTVNVEERTMTVRPVAAKREAGKSYTGEPRRAEVSWRHRRAECNDAAARVPVLHAPTRGAGVACCVEHTFGTSIRTGEASKCAGSFVSASVA